MRTQTLKVVTILFAAMFSAVIAMAGQHALAQTKKVLGAASLENGMESLSLSPYTIVQKDPSRKIRPDTIRASGGTILSGKLSQGDKIFLGVDGAPTWLTIKLVNNSDQTGWYIDLGRRMEGKLGYLKSARLYEFRPRTADQPAVLTEIPQQTGRGIYKVSLPRGSQTLIVLELLPVSGIATVVPVKIFNEKPFLSVLQARENIKTSFCLALGGFALFFLMKAGSRRRLSLIVYGAYFIYMGCLWLIYDYMGSMSGPSAFDELFVVMILGYSLFSILMVKMFCGIDQSSYTEKYIVYGLAWLNVTATLLFFFLPRGDGSTHAGLLYGAPLLTLCILAAMSYAQAKNGQIPGYAFCMSWLMPLFGLALTVIGACQLCPPEFSFLNAFWYALFIQGVFLSIALHQKLNREAPSESGFLNAARLKDAKNSADHAQLLKVIDKEREILAEFRRQETLRIDEMRRSKEAADEANRAKSAFLAVVSHEIRTPMTGIMGMVRLLMDSSLTKQQKDHVMTIQESADAMLALLNDILDFEKIQRGKLELENISFDLHRLIQGIVNLMSGHAVQKNITLSARMDDDIPRFVKGDPTRLRQVLLNLMGNAIKFTSAGSVTLLVKSLDQQTDSEKPRSKDMHMIYFAVQDTGIGIPPEAQKNLFTPFTQVDSSVTRKFGGTGLGLAISKGLIDAMGSTVNINSQPGEGSTFFFTLGMRRGIAGNSEPQKTAAPFPAAGPAKPLRILVVDDNAINCKVVKSFLEHDKHIVTTSSEAMAALDKIQKETFDLVLMDIELPGMRGNEAVRLLRDYPNKAKANIPVIAMTGNVYKEDMEKYLSDGMNGFIGKPIDPEKLQSIVNDIAAKTYEREIKALGRPKASMVSGPLSLQDMDVNFEFDTDDNEPYTPPPSPMAIDPVNEAQEPFQDVPESQISPVEGDIFNANVLKSLKDTIGGDPLNQLLDELIVKTDEIIGAMQAASAGNDVDAVAARAHELKGMAGNFGLVEISDIANLAERFAKTGETAVMAQHVQSLTDASERAKNALRLWAAE